jgi:hypothetical protein
MSDVGNVIALLNDRTREQQLLERCLQLEAQVARLYESYLRRCGTRHWRKAAAVDAEIAQLHDIDRLTLRQIAVRLDMPESTVQYRYRRTQRAADGSR